MRTQTASADHSLILVWGWEQASSRCEVTTTHQVSTLDMFTRPVSNNLATANSEGSLLLKFCQSSFSINHLSLIQFNQIKL